MKAPCQNCKDRRIGCHDKCDKYKAFRLRVEAEKVAKAEYLAKHHCKDLGAYKYHD